LDLHQAREHIRKCAGSLSALFPPAAAVNAMEANLQLGARTALRLCECEPAAWGNAPAAIARLLLPAEPPAANEPKDTLSAASYWALHLFTLLCAFPTIQRALIEVAPVQASGETLTRLRKRMDEMLNANSALYLGDPSLSAFTQIILQLMNVKAELLRAILEREAFDLRLVEYAVRDMEEQARQAARQSNVTAPIFNLIADRANAAAWECDRLMQHARASGVLARRTA
jgi:hypothetical protein